MKITLSGVSGSGKGTVGNLLAKEFSSPFVSTGEMFRQIAKDKGISLNDLHKRAETEPDIDRMIDDKTMAYGAEHTNFIFDARLAWHFIPDSYKVFLDCEDSERFRRISDREKIKQSEAEDKTIERENLMRKQYKIIYGIKDYMEKSHFDIVIDTTKLTPQQVVDEIISRMYGKKK